MAERQQLKFKLMDHRPLTDEPLTPEEIESYTTVMIEAGKLLPPEMIPFLECEAWLHPPLFGVNLLLRHERGTVDCEQASVKIEGNAAELARKLAEAIQNAVEFELEGAQRLMAAIRSKGNPSGK